MIRLKILSATCARELKEGQDAGMLEKLLGPTYLLYIVGLPENRILLEIYGKHLAMALSKWGQQFGE